MIIGRSDIKYHKERLILLVCENIKLIFDDNVTLYRVVQSEKGHICNLKLQDNVCLLMIWGTVIASPKR